MSHKKYTPELECTLYVQGMHCSSCELIIEKKILKHENVSAVTVSRKDNSVHVTFDTPDTMHPETLNNEFRSLGYVFGNKPPKIEKKQLFYKNGSGSWKLHKPTAKKLLKFIVIIGLLLWAFVAVERMQLGRFVSVDAESSFIAFFLLGLVAGASSCAALVGGLLLSMIKRWHEAHIDEPHKKSKPHIMFHVGRFVSFFMLGGILGLLGEKVSLDNTTVYAVLVGVISLVMLILALQMLEVSWAQRMSISMPKFLTKAATKERSGGSSHMPFITGALTFFLPCGFTLIAQGIALTTGSFFSGALIMAMFALGTFPLLLGISITGVQATKKPHVTAAFSRIAGVIIIFFAVYNINGQLNVLGYPSLSDLSWSRSSITVEGPMSIDPSLVRGNIQQVQLIARNFEYVPVGATTFTAGIPTELVVDDQGVLGCGVFLASRGLINGFVELKRGNNTIDLGTPKKGTYKITCSMGMVPPVTIRFK